MTEAANLLHSLGEIARIVHEGRDPQDVLERMAYAVCFNSPWQSSSIMVVDEAGQQSIQVANFSRSISDATRPKAWDLHVSPARDVVKSGKPVIITDALNEQRYMGYWQQAQIDRFRTVVLLPLRISDDLGRPMVISLQAPEKFEVTETMLAYLSTVADLAGMALDKGQRLSAERAVGIKLESMLELQRSIVTQALWESSLDALLPLCRKHLPHPFVIVDLVSGRADCGGFADNDAFRAALNGSSWRQVEQLFRDRTPTRFEAADQIEVLINGSNQKIRLFAEPILAGGQTIGGLGVVTLDILQDDIVRTAEAIWMALSVALMRHHIAREAVARTVSQSLTDLLEGRLDRLNRSESDELSFTSQPHRIIAVRSGRASSPSSIVEWSLGRLAEAAETRIRYGVVGSFLVFLVPSTEVYDSHAFGERLLAEARRVAGREVILVESNICYQATDYPVAWRQLLRLSEWAAERSRFGRISTTDTGAFGLLAGILDYGVVEDFCGSVLNRIRAHDDLNATPLLPTVAALVRHGGRLQPAASDLGVHITTVKYRLERLKELFGLDLRDGDTRFTFDLALRLDALTIMHRAPETS